MDSSVEIYPMRDIPHGRAWMWFGTEMLVVEEKLNSAERDAAIDEAFADLRHRTLPRGPVGLGTAVA